MGEEVTVDTILASFHDEYGVDVYFVSGLTDYEKIDTPNLVVGKNTVYVAAEDEFGNVSVEQATITIINN